jgi:hypothetical protein
MLALGYKLFQAWVEPESAPAPANSRPGVRNFSGSPQPVVSLVLRH